MAIKCKTLLWLFFQQILILNGQLFRPPPILQWFIPLLNPGNQTPTQQTPTQQTPNNPLNLLNFLQLIRPAPGSSSSTPANTGNISPLSNGIIPFLLQYHLQNFRPTLGQQEQQIPGNQPQIPQNFNVGNFQGSNLIPSNLGNINDITPLQLQQLQQLLQGSNLGINPILLGLQPIPPNQLPGFGSTSETITPIAGANGLTPAFLPNIPTISPTNSVPVTVKPTESGSFKPVSEFNNDFQTSESPFVSLAPVKPYEPFDPTMISYIPYTTTVKPFIATTTESDDFEDFKPPVFPDPDQLSPFPTRTTREPSRTTTTFVPLFYERAESTNAQNSSNQKVLTEKIPSTLNNNSTEQLLNLSSVDIATSEMPPSSTVAVEKVNISSEIPINTKESETKIDSEKVEHLNLTVTNATQANLNGKPLDVKIEPSSGIKKTEQSKDNVPNSPSNEKIEFSPDSDSTIIPNSHIESATESSVPVDQTQPIETQSSINLIPIQSDEIPTSFIQGDELPNDKISLEHNDALDVPTIVLNPSNQFLFGQNPEIQQQMQQTPNGNPFIIIDRVPYQGNYYYPNIPHFAYLGPYSNWLHPAAQARNWPPMQHNNFPRFFNFPR